METHASLLLLLMQGTGTNESVVLSPGGSSGRSSNVNSIPSSRSSFHESSNIMPSNKDVASLGDAVHLIDFTDIVMKDLSGSRDRSKSAGSKVTCGNLNPFVDTDNNSSVSPSLDAGEEEGVKKRNYSATAKEKNRERERNRRKMLKLLIEDCSVHLSPQPNNSRTMLKKEVLNGCSELLQECNSVRMKLRESKDIFEGAKLQKECVDDCIRLLTNVVPPS